MRAALPLTRPPVARRRRGFTLVEMLVVIIIIGLLTSLLVVAIGRAMIAARDARVIAEITQLDSAIKQYKDKYGAYPPSYMQSTLNNDAVVRHLRKAFPRMSPTGISYTNLNPAEAFVFFLGGVPASTGSTKTTGFNLNPANPMAAGGQRSPPIFQFDQSRLQDLLLADGTPGQNGFYEYYPEGMDQPYVYIDADHYAVFPGFAAPSAGTAFPYKDEATSSNSASGATSGGFMNPGTFQIIAAGQDNHFGNGDRNKIFPSGANFIYEDGDNLTNFSSKRLEESLP